MGVNEKEIGSSGYILKVVENFSDVWMEIEKEFAFGLANEKKEKLGIRWSCLRGFGIGIGGRSTGRRG